MTNIFELHYKLIREHHAYAKRDMHNFLFSKDKFLGHVISNMGIFVDPFEVKAVLPRSFLGLSGSNLKCIENLYEFARLIINRKGCSIIMYKEMSRIFSGVDDHVDCNTGLFLLNPD